MRMKSEPKPPAGNDKKGANQMAVKYEAKEFEKVGKRPEGVAAEKYTANQLVENISSESADSFLTDVLEVSGGDWKTAAEMFTRGANSVLKSLAGESDEASKAARLLFKMGVNFGTDTPQALAQAIREGKIKAS